VVHILSHPKVFHQKVVPVVCVTTGQAVGKTLNVTLVGIVVVTRDFLENATDVPKLPVEVVVV
jgi:hypothetical protein